MRAAAQFMRNGFGMLDMRARMAHPVADNTRRASPRSVPGGFLVYRGNE